MCGIVGKLQFNNYVVPLDESSLAPLRHRGPDGEGFYHDNHISMGHTRLAIIDLSDQAKQPMRSHDGRYCIIYNGEIYNYLELRSRLESSGAIFKTHSDTEVILEAYRYWGKDCVKHFRGMFAFALWDTKEQTLFLARDRCGERPLVYYRDSEKFIFASEIKALLPLLPHKPELDPSAVDMYMHYQFTPEPFTLLQGVIKLPAAHTLTLSKDKPNAAPERYWCVEDTPAIKGLPRDTPGILRCIREAFEESVKLTLRADVPVAVALSGGIDSGAIAALAQKNYPEPMHAFSIGYPGKPPYDEREEAKELAKELGLIFHEVEIPNDSFVDFFPELLGIMDEPIADIAAFGHYSVPKAAHDLGIKVLLTGIGGDELFWGYDWVIRSAQVNQSYYGIIKKLFKPGELKILNTPKGFLYFYDLVSDFNPIRQTLPSIYGPAMRNLSSLNAYIPMDIGKRSKKQIPGAVIRLLFDTWLVGNCLTLGDRVSMGASVESRLPFLEPNFIELVMALRRNTPDHKLGQKAWLRAALKGVLPDEVLSRPKRGFQPPVWEWTLGVIEKYGNCMENGCLQKNGIITPKGREEMMRRKNESWNDLFLVYKFVMLEMWYCFIL